ncbi:unnamed protein product [Trichogramma brassicae]|uniref:Post-GPI attachment to proteins factor 3 n=1 Tax=Trichogramma brassicae TaxID=86971 RepID=A0A6H5J7X2_9HYME|nr:unnamed protein product [Trichogramma brassicae]
MSITWAVLIVLIPLISLSEASIGDRSQFYNSCLGKCRENNCTSDTEFKVSPPLSLKLLFWTCTEDCKYNCMWKTVHLFTSRGLHVPQFHGKWPFIRILGLQEPASVLFSLLNFYAHATYYWKLKKKVTSSAPMFFVWTWFTAICLHGWFWSAVFHARDKDFTEVMDYTCAFAIVLTLLYCLLLRILYKNILSSKVFMIVTSVYCAILYTHLTHLWSGKINYGFITFLTSIIWWYRNHLRLPHVHLVGWFTVLTVSVTLLEVSDFPPIFWIFDAHSLWHAATAPLVNLLYR